MWQGKGWTVRAVVRDGLPQFKITGPNNIDAVPYGSKMTFPDPDAVRVYLAARGVGLDDLQEVA